ncbi:hypothetical protein GCM10023149_30060 [Mucilaginibacter gynuensis]|uniref:Uncharacterized protein n=1 Tax=Mucilaginibacter gynuensis TaxID=1302236 RepID=A0ABP8GMA3_9SPHI
MIKTIDMAFSMFPKKNVLGIIKRIPIATVKNTKTGTADLLIPRLVIMVSDAGLD